MAHRIDTVSGRARLPARREPYWHRVAAGRFLGYRKMTPESAGSWLARVYVEHEGKQQFEALGTLDDVVDNQRFDAAMAAARKWFDHLGRGGAAKSGTVADVCKRYVTHVTAKKGAKAAADTRRRFDTYVVDDLKLAEVEISKLTPAIVGDWLDRLRTRPTTSGGNRGQQRTASTLNRDMTCFRAALNLAHDDGLVTTDFAWRVKLRPMVNVDKKRETYLDIAQRRKLIEHADDDVGQLMRAMSMLPLRPGAMAALTVADFDKRLQTIVVRDDKANAGRRVKLPPVAVEFFTTAAASKLPAAPLLSRAGGGAWNKDAWKWPVKAAAKAAKLPDEVTLYTLRHSVITDLVHDQVDLLTVAQIAGTSVRMIEQHYGHLRDNVAVDALSRLAL